MNSGCPSGSFTPTYLYDDENRIIVGNGVFYYYDGDGNRVAKCDVNTCLTTVGTTGTFYWRGSDGETLVDSDIAGSFQYEYIFFNGKRVSQRNLTTNLPNYYYADHLGSTSVVTDANGNVQNESDYYPYGGEVVISNLAPQNYKFTGKERDTESGNDYFGARYHGSSLGRFMTPDPLHVMKRKLVDPQQWNMYAYVRNNPLRFVDPTGMYTTSCTQKDVSKCDQNTQNFEKARQAALQSKDKDVVAAAKAYGDYGEKNNVAVGFQNKEDSNVSWAKDAKGNVTGVNVSINSDKLSGITKDSTSGSFAFAVADVSHEGSHVQKDMALVNNHFDPQYNITNRQLEIPAYRISNSVMQSYGYGFTDAKGNFIDLSSDKAINNYLNSLPPDPQEPLDDPIYKP